MSKTSVATTTLRHSNNTRLRTAGLVLVGLSLAAAASHYYLGANSAYATGPLAVLNHLFDLLCALSVSFILLAAGHSLAKRFSLQFASSAETLGFSFMLGTGVVALLILLLGLLGLLRGWAILALLLIALAIATRDFPELFQCFGRAIQTSFAVREARIVATLFLVFIAVLIARALTPPHIPDELIYHLPVPQRFLQEGRIFPHIDSSFGNMPFLVHMVYVVFLLAGSDVAAKLFSLFLAITTAILLYSFCSRFLTRRVGVLAMFGFFAAGVIVEVAVTARIDVSLAGMLFASTYGMINYLATRERGWLWISALFAGFSLGIKHTAALWIFFIGVLYIVESVRNKESTIRILRLGVMYTLIALAIASPWYIKNAVWFHNPLYPFMTGEVAELGLAGVRYFNADDERKLDAHFDVARREIPAVVAREEEALTNAVSARIERHPMRLWEFFFRPNVYLMAEPYQFPNYLFLIIPLCVLLKPPRRVVWLLVLGFVFVLSVTASSWIARYLVPAYPALTIVAAWTLENLGKKQSPSFMRLLPIYALAVAFATVLAPCVAWIGHLRAVPYLAGKTSRHEFLNRHTYYRSLAFVNEQLPQNTRVMMIGAQMNYGLERPYYADESWFATKWRRLLVHNDSLESVNEDLKAQGVTHILYNPGLFRFAALMGVEGTGGMSLIAKTETGAQRSPEYPLLRNWATFTLYKERYLELVYKDADGDEVLRIK